jgi:hypothetical protein
MCLLNSRAGVGSASKSGDWPNPSVGRTIMKVAGALVFILGLFGALGAWNLDTTVATEGTHVPGQVIGGTYIPGISIPSTRVHNLGLMEQRRNYLLLSCTAIVVAVLLVGFGELQSRQILTPEQAAAKRTEEMRQWNEQQARISADRARWEQAQQRRQERAERTRERLAMLMTAIRRLPGRFDAVILRTVGE